MQPVWSLMQTLNPPLLGPHTMGRISISLAALLLELFCDEVVVAAAEAHSRVGGSVYSLGSSAVGGLASSSAAARTQLAHIIVAAQRRPARDLRLA